MARINPRSLPRTLMLLPLGHNLVEHPKPLRVRAKHPTLQLLTARLTISSNPPSRSLQSGHSNRTAKHLAASISSASRAPSLSSLAAANSMKWTSHRWAGGFPVESSAAASARCHGQPRKPDGPAASGCTQCRCLRSGAPDKLGISTWDAVAPDVKVASAVQSGGQRD